MITLTVVSPVEYEKLRKKQNYVVHYGIHDSPFGKCLIGLQGKKICHLSFVTGVESKNLGALKQQWLGAALVYDKEKTEKIAETIFKDNSDRFEIALKGTSFQVKVWQALLNIPRGSTRCYEDIAIMINRKTAVRAVANAVAKNPVCYLIPCHRVIRKNGDSYKYRWGSDIKKKLLNFEKSSIKQN